ncbi:hypothetical protein AZE42_04467 [Rhizopogon vesiculosus]|uniref:Uncharacterized protein n=1 Tax=Rhizopogon vesiculosus TaxID=180088 RepID=A0A1J8QJE8_9AGAM|nr:hypothetical protein AZE42_04467 [Rhizopogon vesiculosus]
MGKGQLRNASADLARKVVKPINEPLVSSSSQQKAVLQEVDELKSPVRVVIKLDMRAAITDRLSHLAASTQLVGNVFFSPPECE